MRMTNLLAMFSYSISSYFKGDSRIWRSEYSSIKNMELNTVITLTSVNGNGTCNQELLRMPPLSTYIDLVYVKKRVFVIVPYILRIE
jgi:hypothetical protein